MRRAHWTPSAMRLKLVMKGKVEDGENWGRPRLQHVRQLIGDVTCRTYKIMNKKAQKQSESTTAANQSLDWQEKEVKVQQQRIYITNHCTSIFSSFSFCVCELQNVSTFILNERFFEQYFFTKSVGKSFSCWCNNAVVGAYAHNSKILLRQTDRLAILCANSSDGKSTIQKGCNNKWTQK